MLISQAWAHNAGVEATGSGNFQLVLLGAAILYALIFVGRGKWQKFKSRRDGGSLGKAGDR